MRRVALGFLALLPLAAVQAGARPIPVCHPGGAGTARDTVVVDYPVRLAPSLLALKSRSPFDASVLAVPEETAPTLVRREGSSIPVAAKNPSPAGQDGLALNGSKTVSVEVGRNRDAALHQTLDLTVRGRVSGNVEVAATVSDQQLPFTPDGNTRELEDLDRLFLSVRGPQGEVTMGDLNLTASTGEFARVMRQLQGVRGVARVKGAQWDVAAATAKGEWLTIELKGEEGKQGAYELTPRAPGAPPPGVVAGSETVWLDGVKLKRGADADYVIDYGGGTLTFATRHAITAQSRIGVDFEQATTGFHRSLYAAFTEGTVARAGRWYAAYMRDGDDAKNPLEASLTPEDKVALSGLGDSAAAQSGTRYVGPGQGDYAWDESDPANPRWVYLGRSLGDYRVDFVAVGAGRGSYADTLAGDGSRFYQYMGKSLGSYVPGGSLPVPTSHQLVDFGGSASVGRVVSLEAEVARSGLDLNQLSQQDDGDNTGSATRLAAQVNPRPVRLGGRSLGAVRASASLRSVGPRFQPMERVNPAFEDERWNQASQSAGEERRELGLEYAPVSGFALRGELGRRALEGESRSTRRAVSADWRGALVGGVRWEGAENTQGTDRGSRALFLGDLSRERGVVRPRVKWLDERIQGQQGDSVPVRLGREWNLGVGLVPAASLRLRASYGERTDRRGGEGLGFSESEARTWEAGLSARARSSVSLEMAWSRRRVVDQGIRSNADLARLALLAGRPGAPVTSELRFDATQLREPEVLRQIVPVTGGTGAYDAFGNPRLGGDYQVVTVTGAPSNRTRADVQVRVDAAPGRAASPSAPRRSFLGGLGLSTLLRVETLSRLPLGNPTYAWNPSNYLDAAATLRGTMSARQTLRAGAPGGRGDVRVELGVRREQSGEYENLRVSRDGFDTRLELRSPLYCAARIMAAATADQLKTAASRTDAPERYESLIRGRGLELELSRSLTQTWSVALLGRARRDRDATRGGWQETWAAGPSARCASSGKLRVDGRALWGSSSRGGAYQPAALYAPAPLGPRMEYDLLGEYRFHRQIAMNVTWAGQRASGHPGSYTGRFELRTYF